MLQRLLETDVATAAVVVICSYSAAAGGGGVGLLLTTVTIERGTPPNLKERYNLKKEEYQFVGVYLLKTLVQCPL